MKVRPTGPRNSPLLAIVGEAPGREESNRGTPFVGASGFLLNQMLATAGISRNECFITNVVDVRPPRNDFGVFYEKKGRKIPSVDLCNHRKRLLQEIKEVNPKIVIALGEEALRSLTQKEGITTYRGTYVEKNEAGGLCRVIPTFHPAHVLRMYTNRSIVELDLKKAFRYAREGVPKVETNFEVRPTLDDILHFFEQKHSPVSCDIETTYGHGLITKRIGFGWSESEAISIPLVWQGEHAFPPHEEEIILQGLKAYLGDPEIKKYFQNAPFDLTVMEKEFGLLTEGVELDTMFAHHLLYPEFPKSLDFLSSIYTDFNVYWEKKNTDDEHNAIYNCYDLCATWIVAQKVAEELKDRKMWEMYQGEIHPAIFALTRMQNRGILIDVEARSKLREKTVQSIEKIKARLGENLGFELNPNSPKQVGELVYERWNLPKQKDLKTKKPTTRDDALRSLARKFPDHRLVIDDILKARKKRVLLSTFIDAELTPENRMHTTFNLAGAVTGRVSSSKTIEGLGGNLMNIPRGSFRRIYTADPGKVLIKADLKQAEYMVFCWSAPVHELIDRYVNDPIFDVHKLNASLIFGIPEEQVGKESKERQDAKNGVYAGNYKVGPLKISRMYDMDFRRAKEIVQRYKAVRPELELWWREIDEQVKTTRVLRNPMGRERIFLGRMDDSLFRSAYSHWCQSTVADLILAAIVTLDNQDVEILLQVHDEIDAQCPKDEVHETVAKIKKAMEIPVKFPNVDVPLVIPAEVAVGENWFDLEDYDKWKLKNP